MHSVLARPHSCPGSALSRAVHPSFPSLPPSQPPQPLLLVWRHSDVTQTSDEGEAVARYSVGRLGRATPVLTNYVSQGAGCGTTTGCTARQHSDATRRVLGGTAGGTRGYSGVLGGTLEGTRAGVLAPTRGYLLGGTRGYSGVLGGTRGYSGAYSRVLEGTRPPRVLQLLLQPEGTRNVLRSEVTPNRRLVLVVRRLHFTHEYIHKYEY